MALLTAPFPQYPDIFGMVRASANDAMRMQVERQQLAAQARNQYLSEVKTAANTALESISLTQKMKAMEEEKQMNLLQLADRRKQQDFQNQLSLQRVREAERHNQAMENRPSAQRAPSAFDQQLSQLPSLGLTQPQVTTAPTLPAASPVVEEAVTEAVAPTTFQSPADFNVTIGADQPAPLEQPSLLLPGVDGQEPGAPAAQQPTLTPDSIGIPKEKLDIIMRSDLALAKLNGDNSQGTNTLFRSWLQRETQGLPNQAEVMGNINAYIDQGRQFRQQAGDRAKLQQDVAEQKSALQAAYNEVLSVTKDEAKAKMIVPIDIVMQGLNVGPLPTAQVSGYFDRANKFISEQVMPQASKPPVGLDSAVRGTLAVQSAKTKQLEDMNTRFRQLSAAGRVRTEAENQELATLQNSISSLRNELNMIGSTINAGQGVFSGVIQQGAGQMGLVPAPIIPAPVNPAPTTPYSRGASYFR